MEVANEVEPSTEEYVAEVKSRDDSGNSFNPILVRLTPTGKVSHAKTRVYTQRYRKEWELMPDFKDWLTSVPYEATRAFCKFCQRNLHAHRLSLLKHMCTLKHQRAGVQYTKRQAILNNTKIKKEEDEPEYIIERYEDDEDEMTYEEETFVQEGEEEVSMGDGEKQEADESESEAEDSVQKKPRLEKEQGQDTLAKAIANVHSDFLTENDESVQLEMVIESDHDNNDNNEESLQIINSRTRSNNVKEETSKNNQSSDEETEQRNASNENVKHISATEPKNFIEPPKKMYLISADGKYSLVNSNFRQFIVNHMQSKHVKNDTKNKIVSEVPSPNVPSTSQDSSNKTIIISNPSPMTSKSVLLKKSLISTNVLDTSKGTPVCGLQVSLYKLQEGRWTFIHEAVTTVNGHCADFLNLVGGKNHSAGRYKLHYDVEKYYAVRKTATIYPFIEIIFDIKDPNVSHNIPLLLSPYSYSTYKDSHR